MTDSDRPLPRHGSEIDPILLADNLEKIAERLREGRGHLQGISVDHSATHDGFSIADVTLSLAPTPDVPILELPIYDEEKYTDND